MRPCISRRVSVVLALSVLATACSGSVEESGARVGSETPSPPHVSTPGSVSTEPQFGAAYKVMKWQSEAQALANTEAFLGRLDVVREYYSGAPGPWPGKAPGRNVVVSFKLDPLSVVSGVHDEATLAWFRAAPRNVDVYWVYWHEPEDDIEDGTFTAAEFKAAFVHLAELARSAGNPRLKCTLVLQSYTLKEASERNWRDYYPGGVVDIFAWDVYNRTGKRGVYTPPQELMGAQVQASHSMGKPFAVAELGSLLAEGDDGTRRARWLRDVGEYLKQQRAVFVTYFDLAFNGGRDDYQLRDVPSTSAWKQIAGG